MALSKRPSRRFLVLACTGLLLAGGATVTSASRNVYSNIKTYSNVLANVYDKYVEQVDSKDLIYASIEGMMNTLDQHSAFLEKKQYEDLMLDTQGKYGGIGISIDIRDEWLTVISPMEGTPAFKLGMRAGDRIIAIEGETTKGITTAKAASKLRGPKGTQVTITIDRPGELAPFDVEITRDVIEVKSVLYQGIARDGIGYVRLIRFSEETGQEVRDALDSLVALGAQGIVFDLRWNHGGLLTQAVSVSDLFLDKGKLISYTQGRRDSDRKEFHASLRPVLPPEIPLVILVNPSTASASEIVAGALQDDGRAVILGELTYGKGLVQTLIPVDAEVNLKLTTAKWYTPSGRCIQREFSEEKDLAEATETEGTMEVVDDEEIDLPRQTGGIQPDIVVEGDRSSRYAFELERKNHFFRFANDYILQHPELDLGFEANQAVVAEFRSYLAEREFTYESPGEVEVERLREFAEGEEYDTEVFQALDALLARFEDEKTKEFDRNREYIEFALERDILSNVFGTEGTYEAILRYDTQIEAAIDLLLDEDAYWQALEGKEAVASVGTGTDG